METCKETIEVALSEVHVDLTNLRTLESTYIITFL